MRPLGLLLALTILLAPQPARADFELLFLDPDANLANIARLRSKMTGFLRTIDEGARFKAFAKLADLERYLATHKVQFVIVGSSVASKLGLELRPVSAPLRRGQTTYHKVLVVKKGMTPAAIKVVATASSPSEVMAIDLPGRGDGAAKLRVLRVSKGFDALLGMTFNRADAAYVTPETVVELERVDKELAASLQEIYRSPPIPNPRLHAVGANVDPATTRAVVTAFNQMHKTPVGRAVLAILDYTGWSEP